MTQSWTRTATSVVTAFSMAVALMVSVFAQSHAATSATSATGAVEETGHRDPCSEHMAMADVPLPADGCLTLCIAADLNHLLGAAMDRIQTPEPVFVLYVYDAPVPSQAATRDVLRFAYERGPPGSELYLITRRIRL